MGHLIRDCNLRVTVPAGDMGRATVGTGFGKLALALKVTAKSTVPADRPLGPSMPAPRNISSK